MIPYSIFLVVSGLAISLAERLWPRDASQRLVRQGFFLDLFYLFFNAEIVGAVVASLLARSFPQQPILAWRESVGLGVIGLWPVWAQALVLLVVKDFLQYNIHRSMHRFGWLWRFHKTHHSSTQLDWLSNWRFHWVEIFVYQLVLYIPANMLGFSAEASYACAVISTTAGHFAHANLNVHLGPLNYLINSPELHTWHHVHPDHGPQDRNFAITFSLWDWLFGTAYWPAQLPARLGLKTEEPRRANV
jgi:sterol desaturase/sphingolipid hydroxylase (fatty acid hydroxylase superfamily)